MLITPELQRRLCDLSLQADGHAFDVRTGRGYSLNATAVESLRVLQQGGDSDAVVGMLVCRCNQHPVVVQAGVLHWLQQLEGCLA